MIGRLNLSRRQVKTGRKSFWYLGVVTVIAILVCISFFYYLKKTETEEPEDIKPKEESLIERQLRELGRLRGDARPLTEEEIQEQLQKLDWLKGNTKPLTEEEIQKQLEELEKLR